MPSSETHLEQTKEQLDAMPSFFLSEWVKYGYLLFDPDNAFNAGNWVFTTEAHPFRVSNETQRPDLFDFPLAPSFHPPRRSDLAGIPSLNQEHQSRVCVAFEHDAESFFNAPNQQNTLKSFRPFQAQEPEPVAPLQPDQERRITGSLPGVGIFEILSTHNSFTIIGCLSLRV